MATNKSFSTETSERYARALFEVSKENNEQEKIENDAKNFQIILKESRDFQNFIKNPTQTISYQNEVVELLSKRLNFSKNLKNFLLLLIEKRRIFFVKKILESFIKLCSHKRGEIKASLISSKELSQIDLDKISDELSNAIGSNLKFNFTVDKELIGGLKLQLGSIMIDTSIKNKLKKYEKTLLEN
tara:strand:- start:1114 stop:1671 length:558 start_codon:yes stop_codon:yes gene_type:complete